MFYFAELLFIILGILFIRLGLKGTEWMNRIKFLFFGGFAMTMFIWSLYLRITTGSAGLPDGTTPLFLFAMISSLYVLVLNTIYWFVIKVKLYSSLNISPYNTISFYSIAVALIAIFMYSRIGPTGYQFFSTLLTVITIIIAFIMCRRALLVWNLKLVLPDDSDKYVFISLDANSRKSVGETPKHVVHFIVRMDDGSVGFPEVTSNIRYALINVDFTPRFTSHTTTNEQKSDILLTLINLDNKRKHIIKAVVEAADVDFLKTAFLYPKDLNNDDKLKSSSNKSNLDSKQMDLDDLIKLKSLLDDGAITQEDYDIKKKQILGL